MKTNEGCGWAPVAGYCQSENRSRAPDLPLIRAVMSPFAAALSACSTVAPSELPGSSLPDWSARVLTSVAVLVHRLERSASANELIPFSVKVLTSLESSRTDDAMYAKLPQP